jgi:hypothetical protein
LEFWGNKMTDREKTEVTKTMIKHYKVIELRNVDKILASFNELEEVLWKCGAITATLFDQL